MRPLQAMESESGIAKWRIAMLAIGTLVSILGATGSVLLALLLGSANTANVNASHAIAAAQAEREYNLKQDSKINLAVTNQATMQSALATLTSNVSALTLQVAHINDRQEQLSESQKTLIQNSRPKH